MSTLRVVRGLPLLFPFHQSREKICGSRAIQYLVSPCRKGPIHLQKSMPSPGIEHRPYSTAVSVINRYTGWAAITILKCTHRD
ncbi:hypothetical protein TNCV_674801 [Trichonephila clavipes]|nr:hypothetical protein TNCV_674801 [Trichonephila clavipes]